MYKAFLKLLHCSRNAHWEPSSQLITHMCNVLFFGGYFRKKNNNFIRLELRDITNPGSGFLLEEDLVIEGQTLFLNMLL